MRVVDLGLCPYREAEALQLRTVDEVIAGGRETLFLVEHPPVITLGRGGGAEHLHADPAWLAQRGVEVVPIARGGNVTCHFPGQLVAYPVFRVNRGRGGVRGFFHNMERAVLETLAHFGLEAVRVEGRPGVWMDGSRKICSMGIGVRRWVAYHGLALNVLADVSLFDLVTPCGLSDVRATSMHAELDRLGAARKPSIQEVKDVLAGRIRDVFTHPQVAAPSLPRGPEFARTRDLVGELGLHTVCQSAKCPNMAECFSRSVATFMVLGERCTRNCAFCNVTPGGPTPVDPDEPRRVAEAAARLGLKYVVVTSVTRDDLQDGGAAHFAAVIRALRQALPQAGVEVLIPDFQGLEAALGVVMEAGPDVINHNVETVPALYPRIRPQARYGRSLELLSRVARSGLPAKSGLMVGLGEDVQGVRGVLADLAEVGVSIATVGQYMRPSKAHPPVERYWEPSEFDALAGHGRGLGIAHMHCAPLVRSSYRAGDM